MAVAIVFLGAIAGGVLAGVIAHWIAGWKVPTWARGLMPVLVIPLVASIVAGFLMLVVFGTPSARPLRTSPLYDLLASRGAVFGSKNGWERANYFLPAGLPPVIPKPRMPLWPLGMYFCASA